jgi:type IV secretory pathway TrbF-like protein
MDTGYLGAKAVWDERVGYHIKSARWWRTAALGSLAVTGLAILLVALLIAQSRHRVIPYVIGIDELSGRTIFAGVASEKHVPAGKLTTSVIYDWVENWRMVSTDAEQQKRAIESVYMHIDDKSTARPTIDEWYRAAPPVDRAAKEGARTVEVRNVLRTGEHSYVSDWVERVWQNGALKSETRWKGAFTVAISKLPPDDEKLLYVNPLGVYVTSASWSQVVESR